MGFAVAFLTIALMTSMIVYVATEFEKGLSLLKHEEYRRSYLKLMPLARLGHSKSQELVGEMHAFGWGVPKSQEDALYWIDRAGRFSLDSKKSASALKFYVGRDFLEGIGTPPDSEEGRKWISMAAREGFPDAITYETMVLRRNDNERK
jgi:TPR repeat protein